MLDNSQSQPQPAYGPPVAPQPEPTPSDADTATIPTVPDASQSAPQPQSGSLANTTAALSGDNNQSPEDMGASAASDAAGRPRTGLFARILYGALNGLRGAGEGAVMGGIPGAIQGAVSPTNAQRAWDQNKQVRAANTQVAVSRADQAMAVAYHDHLINNELSDEMKGEAYDRGMAQAAKLQSWTGQSPMITEDSTAAVAGAKDQLQKQNGGVMPVVSVVHMPGTDGQNGYMAVFDLSRMSQSKIAPDYVKEYADKTGQDVDLLKQRWANGNVDQRTAMSQQALQFLNPQLDSSNPVGQALTYEAMKRGYLIKHAADPNVADDAKWFDDQASFLRGQFNDVKSAMAQQGKLKAQQAGQQSYQEAFGRTKGEQDALNSGTIPGQPNARQALIDDIGNGRVQLTPGMLRAKDGQALLQQVVGKYPDYDPTEADAYKKTREDFTSGKTSTGINSYNTAIAHLGTMFDHVSNASSVDINNPFSDVHRQLDLDKQLVSTELAKAVSNGNMTEGEKNDLLGSISGYTVGSYKTRIQEAAQLLNGKLESFQQQWSNGMPRGAVSPVPIVSPQSDATLKKITGNGPSAPQGRAVRDSRGNILGYTTDGKTMMPVGGQ